MSFELLAQSFTLLAQVAAAGYDIIHIAGIIIVVVGVIAVVLAILSHNQITIPPLFRTLFWIVVSVIAGLVALGIIAKFIP